MEKIIDILYQVVRAFFLAIIFFGSAMMTHDYIKKDFDPRLKPHLNYFLDRCEAIGRLEYCKEKVNNISGMEITKHKSWRLAFKDSIVGMCYWLFGRYHIYISEYAMTDNTFARQVTVHEIGHALGLRHNEDSVDIMNAYMSEWIWSGNIDFHTDRMIERAYQESIEPMFNIGAEF